MYDLHYQSSLADLAQQVAAAQLQDRAISSNLAQQIRRQSLQLKELIGRAKSKPSDVIDIAQLSDALADFIAKYPAASLKARIELNRAERNAAGAGVGDES